MECRTSVNEGLVALTTVLDRRLSVAEKRAEGRKVLRRSKSLHTALLETYSLYCF